MPQPRLLPLFASLAAACLATPAAAQDWVYGYGQGIAVARIDAPDGVNLVVRCPEGGIGDTSPRIAFGPDAQASGSGAEVVGFVIDGLTYTFRGSWNGLNEIQVVAGTHATRAQFDELIGALRAGGSVRAFAGNFPHHDFPLRGSSKALGYVMGFCP